MSICGAAGGRKRSGCNFRVAPVLCSTGHGRRVMETNGRRNAIVLEGWPVLLACVVYAMAFCILAVTMTPVFRVA